jgi:hypothetical protein
MQISCLQEHLAKAVAITSRAVVTTRELMTAVRKVSAFVDKYGKQKSPAKPILHMAGSSRRARGEVGLTIKIWHRRGLGIQSSGMFDSAMLGGSEDESKGPTPQETYGDEQKEGRASQEGHCEKHGGVAK